MKRLAVLIGFGCWMVVAGTAMATSDFSKQWKAAYLGDDVDEEFKKTATKEGCYICHVKGEDKKKVRNEYGNAINEYLKAKDFPKDYMKDHPEEAKAKILEGFKKAGKHKSKDGKTFEEKLENKEIPATDSGT